MWRLERSLNHRISTEKLPEDRKKRTPSGSIGSSRTSQRTKTGRKSRSGEKGSGKTRLVSSRSRTALGPTREEKRRESRAVQLVLWLSTFIFLVLSGTMLTYQSWAFLAGDKADTVVPEVVGMNYTDAGPIVEDAGLVLRIRSEGYSDSVVRDDIIEQVPGAGALVKIGRDLLVDISLGSRTLTTPNVIGLDRAEAQTQLEAIGINCNFLTPRYSDVAESGTIINQRPQAGTPIAIGESVELVSSAGPLHRSVEMPRLEGLAYEEALELIDEAHLQIRRISRTYLPGVREITVSSQYPLPGSQVSQGTEVLLTLSVPSSYMSLGQRSVSVSVRVPESAGTVRLRITVQDRYETKEVYSNDHTGPATVEQLVSGYGRTTIRVYFDNDLIREETF